MDDLDDENTVRGSRSDFGLEEEVDDTVAISAAIDQLQQPAPPRTVTPQPFPPRLTPSPFASPPRVTPPPFASPHITPPPFAPVTPSIHEDRQLASLAALSLDRSPLPSYAAPARTSSSKLPWILLALVVVGGGYYHIRTVRDLEAQVAAPPPATGSATTHTAEESASGLLASGYVAAKVPIVLSATTSGRLKELKVDTNDLITKGEIVASLDDSEVRAELGLANAQLRDAERAAQRMRTLAKAQAATAVDLEHAIGQVEVAGAQVRVVQQKIETMRIRSPINGTVLEVLAHPGESLTVGTSGILRIADLSALVAEVDVAEADLKNVYMGQATEVKSDSLHGHHFRGVVRQIAEQADRSRGTILVRVEISPEAADVGSGGSGSAHQDPPKPTDDAVLKPGMAVQVRFEPKPVPAAAP